MDWIIESWPILWQALVTTFVMLLVVLIIVRINGLRSFAKITPLDFLVTVIIGSVINSTILTDDNSIIKGLIVIAMLLAVQTLFGKIKSKIKWFDNALYNDPVLVMEDGEFLEDNMKKLKISKELIISRLRESNIKTLAEVQAVVMETTGDFSVISGITKLDKILLQGVKRTI